MQTNEKCLSSLDPGSRESAQVAGEDREFPKECRDLTGALLDEERAIETAGIGSSLVPRMSGLLCRLAKLVEAAVGDECARGAELSQEVTLQIADGLR